MLKAIDGVNTSESKKQLIGLLTAYQKGSSVEKQRASECLLYSFNRNFLCYANLISKKLYDRYGCKELSHTTFTWEDLYQEACFGAMQAFGKYDMNVMSGDPDRAIAAFITYVHIWQDGAIKEFVCKMNGVSDHYVKMLIRIKKQGLDLWFSDENDLAEAVCTGKKGARIKNPEKALKKLRKIFCEAATFEESLSHSDNGMMIEDVETEVLMDQITSGLGDLENAYLKEVLLDKVPAKVFCLTHAVSYKEQAKIRERVFKKVRSSLGESRDRKTGLATDHLFHVRTELGSLLDDLGTSSLNFVPVVEGGIV